MGLSVAGSTHLTVTGSVLDGISGGQGLEDAFADGGDAVGLMLRGQSRVTLQSTTIRNISGGAEGTVSGYAYDCDGTAGNAVAVWSDGEVDLNPVKTQISGFAGGEPYVAPAVTCSSGAGAASGFLITGGTISIRDSQASNLGVWLAQSGGAAYGIRTQGTEATYLGGVRISSLRVHDVVCRSCSSASRSPFCPAPPGKVFGIASQDDAALRISHTAIEDLQGSAPGGTAIGIQAQGTASVMISTTEITELRGGWIGLTARGISVKGPTSSPSPPTPSVRSTAGMLSGRTISMTLFPTGEVLRASACRELHRP